MRGQKARSGRGTRPGFEGGQTPMHRRFPKLKGIAGGMGAGRAKYVTVNVDDISAAFAANKLAAGSEVSIESLKAAGVIKASGHYRKLPLKVLGDGDVVVLTIQGEDPEETEAEPPRRGARSGRNPVV